MLSYARLRAIENRRSIARSANTGISAFIDAQGRMSTSLGYEEQGALKGSVGLNSKLTFYSKHGDYIAGFSKYSFVILLILSLGRVFRKKS